MEHLKNVYQPIGIQKLSHAQEVKLLHGHPVRVKHGSHSKIHVSKEQHKKIMKSHKAGKGCNITLDPFQMEMHKKGGSIWDDIRNTIEPIASTTLKTLAPVGIDLAKNYLQGKGMHKHKHMKGEGFFDDLKNVGQEAFKTLAPIALPIAGQLAKKQLGLGLQKYHEKRRQEKHGSALLPAGGSLHSYGKHKKHGGDLGSDILSGLQSAAPIIGSLLPALL